MSSASAYSWPSDRFSINSGTKTLFVAGCCIMSATTNLKAGPVQFGEIFLIGALAFYLAQLYMRGGTVRASEDVLGYARRYGILIAAIVAMMLWDSANETFFPPPNYGSVLQLPPWVGLSRSFELLIVVANFLFLAQLCTEDPALRVRCVRIYVAIGTFSAAYSLLCAGAYDAHIGAASGFFKPTSLIGGAYHTEDDTTIRARGFFVEGGPFGVYLCSTILLALAYPHLGIRKPRERAFALLTQASAFLLSASKAGLVAVILLLAVALVNGRRAKITGIVALAGIGVIVGFIFSTGMDQKMYAYYRNARNIEYYLAAAGEDDINLISGRVAGLIIVPRMIARYPVSGVGLGNYSMTRNDPAYRGYLPRLDTVLDLSGLGLLGYLAELGFPLMTALLFMICRPLVKSVLKGAGRTVITIAAFQPVAHLVGAQVTFFYPWVLSALAVSMIASPVPENERPAGARSLFAVWRSAALRATE